MDLLSQIKGLEVENLRLKKKIKIVQRGDIKMPPFDRKGMPAIHTFISRLSCKPKDAYLWGWESAIFECGEILSKL